MRNRLMVAVVIGIMIGASVARGDDPPPTVKSVGDKVMCLCGCVAILNQCPHQGCSTHDEVQAAIQKMISEGKDEKAILQALSERYGMQILAAPPPKGFHLAAWILPSAGMIFGLVIVIVVVRRWRKPAAAPVVAPMAVDPKLLAAVEEEMKTSGLETRD